VTISIKSVDFKSYPTLRSWNTLVSSWICGSEIWTQTERRVWRQ